MPMDDRNMPPIDKNNNNEDLIFEGNDSVTGDHSSNAENVPSEKKNPEGKAVSSSDLSGKNFVPLAGAASTTESKQKRIFKKTRAGEKLSQDEVKAIKQGRKKLRRELRSRGIKSRKEFELTAASLGLYFDKNKHFGLLLWFFHGRGLWALLGALAALLAVLFGLSMISDMQGHFTINISNDLFREGFLLSETVGFENPTTHLFTSPSENVPCISITDIDPNINNYDGRYSTENYFAYTYYIRNEGESSVDYSWAMKLNSESQNLSSAVWVMIFEDDKMVFYAKPGEDGEAEALPTVGDDTRGYLERPLYNSASEAGKQYQIITTTQSGVSYYRIVPHSFLDDTTVAEGYQTKVVPHETHKYTIVIWLEGDDPDCTNDLIGGHVGMEMQFTLVDEPEEEEKEETNFLVSAWKNFLGSFKMD